MDVVIHAGETMLQAALVLRFPFPGLGIRPVPKECWQTTERQIVAVRGPLLLNFVAFSEKLGDIWIRRTPRVADVLFHRCRRDHSFLQAFAEL